MATATSPSPDDGTNNKRPKKDREPPQRPMHHPHHYSYGPPPPPHVYYGPPGYPPHLPMAPPAGMGAPPGMPPYGRERKVDYYHPYPGMPYGGGGPTSPRRHRPIEMYPREMEVGGGIIRGMDDDGTSSAGGSTKDKSRGNYKCGRCGQNKKGHVCPYQPKPSRDPKDPPPETKNAAVQVEMDEFMTIRRLNLRIQGFPESYANEPYNDMDMVGHESFSPVETIPPPPAVMEAFAYHPVLDGLPPDQHRDGLDDEILLHDTKLPPTNYDV